MPPFFFRWSLLSLLLALFVAVGCAPHDDPDADEDRSLEVEGQPLISDEPHKGTKGFFFLKPVATPPSKFSGVFESRLAPEVRIDRIDAQGNSLQRVAIFTRTATKPSQVRRNLANSFYVLRWRTGDFTLDPKFNYRARIFTGGKLLGYVDIDVAANKKELSAIDTSKYAAVLAGKVLPIRFRIEKKAVDIDGDGVFDWLDNCPSVKNPPTRVSADVPVPGGTVPKGCDEDESECNPNEGALAPATFTQPDADKDGIGDACDCQAGYEGGGLTSCVDIDECTKLANACDLRTACTNTPGSYTCSECPAGFTGNGKTGCVDINECTNGTAQCFRRDTCSNTAGGYQCGACPTGLAGDGKVCFDINECATGNGGCAAEVTCTNTIGSFKCGSCPEGYTGDGTTCTDIDECAASAKPCDYRTTCTNTPGSFSCSACPAGYVGNGKEGCLDIDECAGTVPRCNALSACVNHQGGFTCEPCAPGYQGDGFKCTDVDECATNNGGCSEHVVCTNTLGSFACGACPTGYDGDGYQCIDRDECSGTVPVCALGLRCTNTPGAFRCSTCPDGYFGSGKSCVNIDECAQGTDTCSRTPKVVCTDTEGGFACGDCPAGYRGDGQACSDEDECAAGTDACSDLVSCTNTRGGYICGECPPGSTGDGKTCTDIDECIFPGCDVHTTCTNASPGWECSPCPDGMIGDGRVCLDLDECALGLDDCSTDPEIDCINLSIEEGRFRCGACPAGFDARGHACEDKNECLVNNGGCDPLATCTNTRGGRTCGDCPEGYDGDGVTCTDKNECAPVSACDPNTTCTNEPGGYTCSGCPAGFTGDGKTGCVDTNECLNETHDCSRDPKATCTNTPGSFTCKCPSGTEGDGKTCSTLEPTLEFYPAPGTYALGVRTSMLLSFQTKNLRGTQPFTFTWVDSNGCTASPTSKAPSVLVSNLKSSCEFVVSAQAASGERIERTVTYSFVANRPPQFSGVDRPSKITKGQSFQLIPHATDPDGDQVSYSWRQTSGPRLDSGFVPTAPVVQGVHSPAVGIEYTATDGKRSSTYSFTLVYTNEAPTITIVTSGPRLSYPAQNSFDLVAECADADDNLQRCVWLPSQSNANDSLQYKGPGRANIRLPYRPPGSPTETLVYGIEAVDLAGARTTASTTIYVSY